MSNFVLRKYKKFYKNKGYIPKMFNPYNCCEVKDIAPTISTARGSTTSSAAVLILVDKVEGEKTDD